jgi:hypothetical protein
MMCPEWALAGTVSTSPCLLERRCAAGEARPARPPGVAGKATDIPLASPLPVKRSVPCVETSCALVLQLAAGMQLAFVIRTLSTCGPEAFLDGWGAAFGAVLPVVVPPGAEAPPGLAAPAGALSPTRQQSAAEATAAMKNMNRWEAPFAKISPFAPENLIASNRRPSTLAAVYEQTEQRDGSCVQAHPNTGDGPSRWFSIPAKA